MAARTVIASGIKALVIAAAMSMAAQAQDPAPKPCAVVFCKDDVKLFLVFETDGTWIDTVRWFEMTVKDGQAAVKLTTWKGTIRPSKPHSEVRTISQLQAVSKDDFMKTVDDLQNTQAVNVLQNKQADRPAAETTGKSVQLNND